MAIFLIFLLCANPALAEEGAAHWYEEAQNLYHEGDLRGALALLAEIPKRFPEDIAFQVKAAILAARIHYEQKEYDEVLALLKPWLTKVALPDEALFLLAAACEAKGLYGEALTYLRLLKSRFPDSPYHCEASLVAARLFYKRKLFEKTRRLAFRVLRDHNCSAKERAQAVSLLLSAGTSAEELLPFLRDPKTRSFAPEVIRALARYHLKKGELEAAEREIFEYLNYSGQEKEAPSLLFELAEAYFSHQKYRQARRLFELINTSWPYTKEAALAKFRLLYMRYLFEEKVGRVREQTRRLLLANCRRLMKEYPQDPLTKEAHALAVRLLFEQKELAACLDTGWAFLKKYPAPSSLRSQVLDYLCRASSRWQQGLLAEKAYPKVVAFFEEHQEAFREGQCALPFFWTAEALLALNLEGEALTVLLSGYGLKIPKVWGPDYLLTLADLLLRRAEKDDYLLVAQLLEKVRQDYPLGAQSPYFLFLRGRLYEEEGQNEKALKFLAEALAKAGDPDLAKRTQKAYLTLLVKLGRYKEAFDLAQKEGPEETSFLKDLARRTIVEERWPLAQQILSFLKKKNPKDPEVLWLLGLLYERQGEGEKALSVWRPLSKDSSLYGELARDLVRAAEILETAREEIY